MSTICVDECFHFGFSLVAPASGKFLFNSKFECEFSEYFFAESILGITSSSSDNIYFQVNASINDSKKTKGYRASIYKCAQECHAYYLEDRRDESICYKDDSNDLSVHLLFANRFYAEEFQNALTKFAINHSHFQRKLTIEKNISIVTLVAEPFRVFYTDYNPEDNEDSHDMSLNDILSDSNSVTSIFHDPLLALQAVEGIHAVLAFGSKWYRCHLISAKNKKYNKEEDNVIYASWPFHQQFDGLNSLDGIGIAICFKKNLGEEEVLVNHVGQYESRHKLEVSVEFKSPDLAYTFERLLKEGTTREEDGSYTTFLYARNAKMMEFCLDAKYKETKQIWKLELSNDA